MSTSKISQKLSTIAASWPTDPFRPTMQLKTFLQSLSAHPNLTPKAVEAANALKGDVIMKKYPLSKKTLEPASRPHYYNRLVEGFEKSSRGIARPWWKVFFGIW
ncbi:hypothetical protein PILCRDRAFT_479495 [Piloderma croceum F 1598]|uniref:Uncharacterized protein n=1 Tax=Piloderma croceum (strain F 1598) TaxID=765440 RepID=A0A0C3FS21_PILCF|nr:hypothetical protein PILCRDRAFT_479495 [Piloderma croceum F 1598]